MKNQKKDELAPLLFLIGKWKTEGRIFSKEGSTEGRIMGTDSYELILDNHYILHKVDVTMNNEKVEAIEMIGDFDAGTTVYKMRSFDNQGKYSEMEGKLDTQGTFQIHGDKMRSTLSISDSNTMVAHWEITEDNIHWRPWMELKLSK